MVDSFPDANFAEFLDLIESIAADNTLLTPRNQYFVVEVIRNIAEYCVFGEKLSKAHMDTFIERNALEYFKDVLGANNKLVNL
jgi:hypothetical protein